MQQIIESSGNAGFELLKKKKGQEAYDRLLGIYVQFHKSSAATNGIIAKKISLANEDLEEFRKARMEIWRSMMDDSRGEIERILQDPRGNARDRIEAVFAKSRKKLDQKLRYKLTDEQRSSLDELAGEEFENLKDLHSRGPRRRGPGPGGPGRPNRGGRDGEPGSGSPPPGRDRERPASEDNCCVSDRSSRSDKHSNHHSK